MGFLKSRDYFYYSLIMAISVVYYFHSSRKENLKQAIRLLKKMNGESVGEIITVCNDQTDEIFDANNHNMHMEEYKKPVMCNFGVEKASFPLVALLDSDRVLPKGYLKKAESTIQPGKFISCKNMMNLKKDYSDEDIEAGNFEFELEERSNYWEIRKKNLFSGNTIFSKKDYMSAGGMDESFVGYGFADNDMTINIARKGFSPAWTDELEIHLFHEKTIMEGGKMVGFEQYKKTSQKNLNKFLKKWKLKEFIKFHRPLI